MTGKVPPMNTFPSCQNDLGKSVMIIVMTLGSYLSLGDFAIGWRRGFKSVGVFTTQKISTPSVSINFSKNLLKLEPIDLVLATILETKTSSWKMIMDQGHNVLLLQIFSLHLIKIWDLFYRARPCLTFHTCVCALSFSNHAFGTANPPFFAD